MRLFLIMMLAASLLLSGCATATVVGTAVGATKVAVKTTVGAGKLAYRGTKTVVKGTARLLKDDEQVEPDKEL